MIDNLKINPEFELLIPALIDDEFELLEKNIVLEGEIYTPIFVWNGYIIDGHHRYRILLKHKNIKYRVVEKEFQNKYEAMSWMCNNQLGRRNLTPENRKYLIGKKYNAEKSAHGSQTRFYSANEENPPSGYFSHLDENQKNGSTRKRVAEETGTTQAYVRFADEFARGVDAAEEAVPGIKKEILSGKIKKSAKEIAEIAKAPEEERKTLTENLRLITPNQKTTKKTIGEIKSIVSDMHDLETPVTDESVLESLDGIVNMFIETCQTTFWDHPNILLNDEHLNRVLEILEKANQYILTIKKGAKKL